MRNSSSPLRHENPAHLELALHLRSGYFQTVSVALVKSKSSSPSSTHFPGTGFCGHTATTNTKDNGDDDNNNNGEEEEDNDSNNGDEEEKEDDDNDKEEEDNNNNEEEEEDNDDNNDEEDEEDKVNKGVLTI